MKRSKILFLVAVFFMFVLTSCIDPNAPVHVHVYGDWSLSESAMPTETEAGEVVRVCECGVIDRMQVAELTDETVWTVSNVVESTCTEEGSKTYTSGYGSVTVTLAVAEHEYVTWTFGPVPTETEAGLAKGACDCGAETEVEVPALTDESVWSVKESVDATYYEEGYKVYECTYGEVRVTYAKLVAAYEGKTYYTFAIDADNDEGGYKYGAVNPETAWSAQTVAIDSLGVGRCIGFPFRGENKFEMIDEATGKMQVVQAPLNEEDPNDVYADYTKAVTYPAYIDAKTGIIVRAYDSKFNFFHVFTPYAVDEETLNVKASSWADSVAVDYTVGEEVHSIFVHKDVVYFDVTFTDSVYNYPKSIAADTCYNANYVYVFDAAGEMIVDYGFDGEKLVEVDGYQETYEVTNWPSLHPITVTGYGKVKAGDGKKGTYQANGEGFDMYIEGEYFYVTLDTAGLLATVTKPMVTVTFDAGTYATVDAQEVNKNIAMTLPSPTCETQTFKGWFYDQAFTQAVEAEFVPTEDVTLYANWKAKVVVNLEGTIGTDPSVIYLGEGDVIGQFLPKYTVDEAAKKAFRGWYLDATFETSLPTDAEVAEEDSNVTIYAKWEDLPAYYGTYKGTEVWGKASGNSSTKGLTIDENGKISGQYTGFVVSYDETTQAITWKKKLTDSASYNMYFDKEAEIVAVYHGSSPTNLSSDYYVFSKYTADGKLASHIGIQCVSPVNGKEETCLRVIDMTLADGASTIVVYGNTIYSNVTVTNTAGVALTAEEVKASKTVVVKDAKTQAIIVAVASQGVDFDTQFKSTALDSYFGVYTFGADSIVLDGTGIVTYGEKTGTYTKSAEGASYTFDVYLENETEYYQLTTAGTNFLLAKPMVTVTYNVGEGHVAVAAASVNKNVEFTLPVLTEENYVFNGWFADAAFTTALGETYTPVEDVTVYAKFSTPAVLTIVYNDGATENGEVVYSVGDTATVEKPAYPKHKFEGWFTTEEFTEGSEWTSGSEILEDTTIYAKWSVAPVYNNKYLPVEFDTKSNGEASPYAWTSAILDISPEGTATCDSFPFRGEITVQNYDKATGKLEIKLGSSIYQAYIDEASGIMIMNTDAGAAVAWKDIYVLTPFETTLTRANYSVSTWNGGKTKAIQYTYDGTTYSFFEHEDEIYMNVSFENGEHEAVAGKDVFKTPVVYVYSSADEQIFKFGFDGTTMQELDGYEGTYTNDSATTVTLDGIKTVSFDGNTGTYTKAQEGASYTFDVYMTTAEGTTYFELTVDKAAMTYVIVKPMVTVTFDAGTHATVEPQEVNKNVAFTLPTPTNADYVFRGWYKDAEFATEAGEFVPTEDCTLYAKWDAKVTLTVVYGNGLENVVLTYGAGDATAPKQPEFTNGQVFDGWYLDAEFTTAYTAGTAITESTTIYCKWMEAVAATGSYIGWNLYGTGNENRTSFSTKLEVAANGKVSGTRSGTLSGSTGAIMLTEKSYAYYCESLGIIYTAYSSSNATSCGTDTYVFFKTSENVSAVKSAKIGLQDDGTYIAFSTIEYSDGKEAVNVAFMNNMVYVGIVIKDASGNVVTSACNSLPSSYTVYDAEGTVLYTK